MDMEKLVEQAKTGDRQAQNTLYYRYRQRSYAVCRRITRDKELSEELVDDAFLVALNKLDCLHDPDKFGSWLSAISARLALRHLKRQPDSKPIPISHIEGFDIACDHYDAPFTHEELQSAIRHLSADRPAKTLRPLHPQTEIPPRTRHRSQLHPALLCGTLPRRRCSSRDFHPSHRPGSAPLRPSRDSCSAACRKPHHRFDAFAWRHHRHRGAVNRLLMGGTCRGAYCPHPLRCIRHSFHRHAHLPAIRFLVCWHTMGEDHASQRSCGISVPPRRLHAHAGCLAMGGTRLLPRAESLCRRGGTPSFQQSSLPKPPISQPTYTREPAPRIPTADPDGNTKGVGDAVTSDN